MVHKAHSMPSFVLFFVVLATLILSLQSWLLFHIFRKTKTQNELLERMVRNSDSRFSLLEQQFAATAACGAVNAQHFEAMVEQMARVFEKQQVLVDDLRVLHSDDVVGGNAKVLTEWKSILPEMEKFGIFFSSLNAYLSDLSKLTVRLDEHEARMHSVERMGNYFVQALKQLEHHTEVVENVRYDMRTSVTKGLEEWNQSLLTLQRAYLDTVETMQRDYHARLASIQEELDADAAQKSSMRRVRQLAEAKRSLEEVKDLLHALLEYAQLQTRYVAELSEKRM